jgi:lipopolysaccharide export system permease protein
MAFAGLIMCMLGIPFAIRQHRKGGIAVSIGIGFMLVFVYWIFFSIMLSLGFSARINAFLSAWLANILFFVFALFMLRKVTR